MHTAQLSCDFLQANTSKGKASEAYERAMEHFNELDECYWHNLLWDLLIEYVTLLTNPDSTTLSTPSHKSSWDIGAQAPTSEAEGGPNAFEVIRSNSKKSPMR